MKVRYFLTSSGRSPIEDFINEQSEGLRKDYFDALNKLSAGKVLTMPLSRNLSSIHPGLHELRLKDSAGQVRVFYFVKRGDAIYMVHTIKKKTQGIPKKEIDIILKRIKGI
jgi:phage-related protein